MPSNCRGIPISHHRATVGEVWLTDATSEVVMQAGESVQSFPQSAESRFGDPHRRSAGTAIGEHGWKIAVQMVEEPMDVADGEPGREQLPDVTHP
jgi:hypothetical protein